MKHLDLKQRAADLGVLGTIGRTPLVRLSNIHQPRAFALYAKLEGFNPSGSSKDRPALRIMIDAIMRDELTPDSVVVESSSGNFGIALAQACSYFGFRFICVTDSRTTVQNLAILQAYNAEVITVTADKGANLLERRLFLVRQLLTEIPSAYWPNQYANVGNYLAHSETTMHEIKTELGEQIDYIFCATSTCGTLRGCVDYVRRSGLNCKLIAVDADGSVIFQPVGRPRLIPGHGASVRPPLWLPDLADECVWVSDSDCVAGCRDLVRKEAILAGGSSGGVITAVHKLKAQIRAGAIAVAILPDRGERYLDTIYNDEWVHRNCGPSGDGE